MFFPLSFISNFQRGNCNCLRTSCLSNHQGSCVCILFRSSFIGHLDVQFRCHSLVNSSHLRHPPITIVMYFAIIRVRNSGTNIHCDVSMPSATAAMLITNSTRCFVSENLRHDVTYATHKRAMFYLILPTQQASFRKKRSQRVYTETDITNPKTGLCESDFIVYPSVSRTTCTITAFPAYGSAHAIFTKLPLCPLYMPTYKHR